MKTRFIIFAAGAVPTMVLALAAAAFTAQPLDGGEALVVAAAPVRTEPGGAGSLVVTLQLGERVRVWAFTYATERVVEPDGAGGTVVTESYTMWYRVTTVAGNEGWVAASALAYPAGD